MFFNKMLKWCIINLRSYKSMKVYMMGLHRAEYGIKNKHNWIITFR